MRVSDCGSGIYVEWWCIYVYNMCVYRCECGVYIRKRVG